MDGRLLNRRNLKQSNYCLLALLMLASVTGCRAGGGVSSTASQNTVTVVEIPTIASPLRTPHYSRDDTLTITGMCMTGYVVTISGDSSEQKTCENSAYSFDVLKVLDGLYTFQITQTGTNGTTSVGAPLVWVKKTSVPPPSITSPASSPFPSAQGTLSINGGCETGATLAISGDSTGTANCTNSNFSFSIPKISDGDYSFLITQTDRAGNTASTNLVWKKYGISVSPNNPSLVVATQQALTISGGSGDYTVTLATNNSGATYNSTTKVYTSGTIAAVNDTLQIVDTLGATKTLTISTVAGAVDHLSLPSGNGDAQIKPVGKELDSMLTVKVVDQYENGISNYPVYFHVVNGDSTVVGNPVRTTNSQGLASVAVRTGFSSTVSEILVKPASGALPDVAATGRSTLTMTQTTSASGKGPLGTTFTVGSSPTASTVVDLNGDTYRDVIVLNSGEPSLGILLGKGNGLLNSMSRITGVCNSPTGFTVGSFNSNIDAFVDIAVSCGGADTIVVYLGRGDGTFVTPAIVISTAPNATIPMAITGGDFNKDGYFDLAIASTGGSVVATYNGNGAGAFSGEQIFNVGLSPNSIATGDFNKDGNLDIIVSNSGDNTLSVLNGNAMGVFGAQTTYGSGIGVVSIAPADFNKDGWLDVAVAVNGEDNVAVYQNDLTGLLEAPNTNPVGVGPTSISTFDYDGDGNTDIVATNSGDSTASVLPGLGNGAFGGAITKPTVLNPSFVSVGDLNGDGTKEIVISGDGKLDIIPVFTGGAIGVSADTGSTPIDAVFGHFDTDIYLDVAVINSGSNSLQVFSGDGKGRFAPRLTLATGISPITVKSADFNHDGWNDLAIANNGNSSVRIFLGKSDGTFEAGVDFTTASGPSGIAIQDFDGDGNDDLAVAASNANRVSVLRGIGDGTFVAKVDYVSGSSPSGVTAIDLNGDDVLDLVTANNSSNDASVLIGNGDGTFRAKVDYATGIGPAAIVSADFNNDGIGDVAVLNSTDATVSILRGVGDGSLSTATDFSTGASPVGLVLGDFNGDTRIDLATSNSSSLGFTTLYGAGNGQFNVTNSFTTDYTVSGLAVGDANGDYALDLIILDSTTSKAHTWLGQ